MARQARRRSATDYYHIIMRGNNKSCIFEASESKAYFMKVLLKIEQEEDMDLVAWCLMDNHVHLVARVQFKSMETVLKRLNVSYAMYYHKKIGSVGHVFEGRAKSLPLESDESLINNVRYVHNNPVNAKMTESAEDYRWSSMKTYLTGGKSKAMRMVKELAGKSNHRFREFHQQTDYGIYLDIKEEKEEQQKQAAQRSIEVICRKYGIIDSKEIYNNRVIMKEIVNGILESSGYSGRKTAEFLGISEGMVRRMRE